MKTNNICRVPTMEKVLQHRFGIATDVSKDVENQCYLLKLKDSDDISKISSYGEYFSINPDNKLKVMFSEMVKFIKARDLVGY